MPKHCLVLDSVFGLILVVSLFESTAARKSFTLTVAAGSLDRRETVTSFVLPTDAEGKFYALRDEAGRVIPLQMDASRQATFVLPELKAGTKKSYLLEALKSDPSSAATGVQIVTEGHRLNFTSAGHQLIGYQLEGELPRPNIDPLFLRGGYIYPVYTPSGRTVTEHYYHPSPRHLHQQSIWFAWTKTEFEGRSPDFWNMGAGTGKVEFVALDETASGPIYGGFKSRLRYVDLTATPPKTALNESWEVKVYRLMQSARPYTMFDLISTQECATASPLILPEYHYGGMGIRGHRDWDGKDNCFFLTSEGKDRSNGHATRARWCHMGGRVDGQLVGIAVLGHPDNFRAPQPVRIHPTEPFFNFAPSQMGPWEITPGKPYISRYRYLVYDGPPDADELNRLWNDYANPPQVTITAK